MRGQLRQEQKFPIHSQGNEVVKRKQRPKTFTEHEQVSITLTEHDKLKEGERNVASQKTCSLK